MREEEEEEEVRTFSLNWRKPESGNLKREKRHEPWFCLSLWFHLSPTFCPRLLCFKFSVSDAKAIRWHLFRRSPGVSQVSLPCFESHPPERDFSGNHLDSLRVLR